MNQPVTINFVPEQVLTWVIIGLLAGMLASFIMRDRFGFVGSIVIGLLGALAGGIVVTLFHIQVGSVFTGGITLQWADIVVSFIGALIILMLFGGFARRRYYARGPMTETVIRD